MRVRATLMTGDGDRVRGNSWSGASQKTGDGDSGQAASVRQTTDLHSLPALWKRAGCVRLPVGPRLINKPQSSSGPGRFAASSGPLRSGAERILCRQASAVAYAVVRPHSGRSGTASSRSRARSHFSTPKARNSQSGSSLCRRETGVGRIFSSCRSNICHLVSGRPIDNHGPVLVLGSEWRDWPECSEGHSGSVSKANAIHPRRTCASFETVRDVAGHGGLPGCRSGH